eukprot:CAMPEP_0119318092 /NCGR_PEP_ID=MMETSP1333-20130426/45408_1 /TAXON_ID=418940 /ORGANISM="Scyphosphaera apsteinii, Strain RCC1455" /LENGTH=285 /DNA_ID=CAMNT_0007324199 /DNA_START=91 /DNA_END=948 /DNA_ORIENTATION=+
MPASSRCSASRKAVIQTAALHFIHEALGVKTAAGEEPDDMDFYEPNEVADTLRNVLWEEMPPFSKQSFRRLDESSDTDFYAVPRFVQHIDDGAVASTKAYYGSLFGDVAMRRYGNELHPVDVLDLCSSWLSHFPDVPSRYARVVGLGINAVELRRNPQLTDFVVQDLNRRSELPFANESFDVCTCTVSIDLLTKPIDIMQQVSRVLRPGGTLAIVFSDRLVITKAVALWIGQGDLEHVQTVGAYIHYGGLSTLSEPQAIDLTPWRGKRRRAQEGDHLYCIYATKV